MFRWRILNCLGSLIRGKVLGRSEGPENWPNPLVQITLRRMEPLCIHDAWISSGGGRDRWSTVKGQPCIAGRVGDSGRPGDICFSSFVGRVEMNSSEVGDENESHQILFPSLDLSTA
jgi:hypothetical protein